MKRIRAHLTGQQSQTVSILDNRITRLQSPGHSLSLSPAFSSCIPRPYSGLHDLLPIRRKDLTRVIYTGCPTNPNPLTNPCTLTGDPHTRHCHLQLCTCGIQCFHSIVVSITVRRGVLQGRVVRGLRRSHMRLSGQHLR